MAVQSLKATLETAALTAQHGNQLVAVMCGTSSLFSGLSASPEYVDAALRSASKIQSRLFAHEGACREIFEAELKPQAVPTDGSKQDADPYLDPALLPTAQGSCVVHHLVHR